MTVPARREAARLLLTLDPPPWFLAHACAVADVAGWLASRIRDQGVDVDVLAAETAALLHDVDKLPAVGRPDGVRHADGSAAWLEANGLPELAAIVRDHPVTRLGDETDAARLAAAPIEARVVAYADKRAGQQLQSMDERFDAWQRRYPAESVLAKDGERHGGKKHDGKKHGGKGKKHGAKKRRAPWTENELTLIQARARDLEREVCAAAGVEPADVRRLRWSRRALREAAG